MDAELIWRYILASFLLLISGVLAVFSLFGVAAAAGSYEVQLTPYVKVNGSSLTVLSMVVFVFGALMLVGSRATKAGPLSSYRKARQKVAGNERGKAQAIL